MADTKISAMAAATTPLTGSEIIPIVQSGLNVQSNPFQVSLTQFSVLASPFSVTSNTTLQATAIQLTVVPATYWVTLSINAGGGAGGGAKIGFATSTSVVASVVNIMGYATNSAAALVLAMITSLTGTGTTVAQAAPPGQCIFSGPMIVTTGGTLNLGFCQAVSNGTACTLAAGSAMMITRIA